MRRIARACTAALLLVGGGGCAPFEPTRPATGESAYTATGIEESITMRDAAIHYAPAAFAVGTPRERVHVAMGMPNATRTTDGGLIEDVYAFNPDGSKFVDPQLRARNVALGFFTMGASVAVRQARLTLAERKLTLVHVLYSAADTVAAVNLEPLSGAPALLPGAAS
jgi:hypothetical protein